MAATAFDMPRLVSLLAPHPATELQLDLETTPGRADWWSVAIVLAGAGPEPRGLQASRRLLEQEFSSPASLARADPANVAAALEALGEARALPVAARLVQSQRNLQERWGGSLEALGTDCDELEELGSRLASLCPGIGASTVLRFLRPLRAVFGAAEATPLLAAAGAAARHLGWGEADDAGAPDALLHHWRQAGEPVAFRDLEAALERLGSRACLRERPQRCPLEAACPLRPAAGA